MATKPRGGGGLKALVAGPLRKELFFVASLTGYVHVEVSMRYSTVNLSFEPSF